MQSVVGVGVLAGEGFANGSDEDDAADGLFNDVDQAGGLQIGESLVLVGEVLLDIEEDVGVQAGRGATGILIGGAIDVRGALGIALKRGMAHKRLRAVFDDSLDDGGGTCVRLLERLKGGLVAKFAGEVQGKSPGACGDQHYYCKEKGKQTFHGKSPF